METREARERDRVEWVEVARLWSKARSGDRHSPVIRVTVRAEGTPELSVGLGVIRSDVPVETGFFQPVAYIRRWHLQEMADLLDLAIAAIERLEDDGPVVREGLKERFAKVLRELQTGG